MTETTSWITLENETLILLAHHFAEGTATCDERFKDFGLLTLLRYPHITPDSWLNKPK